MIIKNNKAFTLVEMVVVITILAILATIGYLSFQGSAQSSRDSARLADVKSIEKALSVYTLQNGKFPIPEEKVDIIGSGSTVISYQGFANAKVLSQIGIFDGGIDPIEGDYYTYSTNPNQTKYQLLIFLEGHTTSNNINKVSARYQDNYPKLIGDKIGIIIDSITKEPIQKEGNDIDIINTNNQYTIYMDNTTVLSGTGETLKILDTYTEYDGEKSCKELLNSHSDYFEKDGEYLVNGENNELQKIYCDMTTSGGGWTLVWHGYPTESSFGITGNEKTSIGANMTFSEIYLTYVNHDWKLESTLTNSVKLQKNFIEYFIDLINEPDVTAEGITFENGVGLTNDTWMFHGSGNCWRKFGGPTYTGCSDFERLYIGQGAKLMDGSGIGWSQPCDWNTTKNPPAGNSQCLYNFGPNLLDDTVQESVSGLTIKQWQESQVFMR